MARPKKTDKERKDKLFVIRMTYVESELIERAAKAIPPSTWARHGLVALAKKTLEK